jgi:hypothetical protein
MSASIRSIVGRGALRFSATTHKPGFKIMSVDIAALKARIGKTKKSSSDVKRTLGSWTSAPFISRDRKTEAILYDSNGEPIIVPFLRVEGIRQGFSLSAVLELVSAAEQAVEAVEMALDHAADPATMAALKDAAGIGSAAPQSAAAAPVVAAQPAAPANMTDKLAALIANKQRG